MEGQKLLPLEELLVIYCRQNICMEGQRLPMEELLVIYCRQIRCNWSMLAIEQQLVFCSDLLKIRIRFSLYRFHFKGSLSCSKGPLKNRLPFKSL